ncbi:hypothetical protein PPSIR1_03098 [Plesiocystis pacifica SIR-1]|uniref:Uncharacterized protein n=1 Tax=Plesiocystis pacifica SIR-1 TaxID=391625 RepID=A6GI14_9BACT|nr:hypothetical protein [Plesiocystis pacifica]EDM74477.1 hypothetical protein PPSIR1_03098 [Plesiocystis pacifica SIR-1]
MSRSNLTISLLAAVALAASPLAGCGGDDGRGAGTTDTGISGTLSDDGGDEADQGDDNADTNDDGPLLDMDGGGNAEASADDGGDDECGPQELPTPDATLTGTVYAPNLELPISGALVYVTDDDLVEPVPDGVYCAECVELGCETPFTLTNADGSFELNTVSGPGQKLVVQKGQFLRVVDFDVPPGNTPVGPNFTNLPGQWNPAQGMYIPRIAVYQTNPDKVYNVLAKFGMGSVDANGNLIQGTENFDLISDTDQGAFLDNLDLMSQYHIIFVPCAATKYWSGAPSVPAARAQNIRAYVEAGGKLYATDHSNEYIEETFPTYQEFNSPAMPDIQPAYTSIAIVVDAELLAWLEALPNALKDIGGGQPTLFMLPAIETVLNYSGIDQINEILVEDAEGELVNVGPKSFVEGPCSSCDVNPQQQRPMAITGQYGCGRMMYSTFENSSTSHAGLNPQELVLLYMILEIGVCFGEPPPPPPPIE